MKQRTWFQLNADSLLSDPCTASMEVGEIGAYVLLLGNLWMSPDCTLPNDQRLLRELCKYAGDMTRVLACFSVRDGRLTHDQLHAEWSKLVAFKAACGKAGKRGMVSRWKRSPDLNKVPYLNDNLPYKQPLDQAVDNVPYVKRENTPSLPITGTLQTPINTPMRTGTLSSENSPLILTLNLNSELNTKIKNKKEGDCQGGVKVKSSRKPKLTDEEFWEALRTNLAYSHLDLPVENSKMDGWLLAHPHRVKTRKFIINWLNRIPAPVKVAPKPSQPAQPAKLKVCL